MIKDYFRDYLWQTCYISLGRGRKTKIQIYDRHGEEDWPVTLADAGENSITAYRLKMADSRNLVGKWSGQGNVFKNEIIEHKQLMADGDETLKDRRHLWLYNAQKASKEQASDFIKLKDLNLKVVRAWSPKELFSKFVGI